MKNIIVTVMAGVLLAGSSNATVSPVIAPMPPAAPAAPAPVRVSLEDHKEALHFLSSEKSVEEMEQLADEATRIAREFAGNEIVARALACKAKAAGLREEWLHLSAATEAVHTTWQHASWVADGCYRLAIWYGEWKLACSPTGNDTYSMEHILERVQSALIALNSDKEKLAQGQLYLEEHEEELRADTRKVKDLLEKK